MLVPSKNHPASIPVWVKLHRLPLEVWTQVGFSKIGSAIGKPIHVDEATSKRRRLDYARICVEIEASDELPTDIAISVNAESVMVGVEYQWLPPRCENCKVFGHSCSPKAASKTTIPANEWVVVGKGKLTSNSTLESDANEGASLSFLPADQGVMGGATDTASSSQPDGSIMKKPPPSSSPLNLHNPAPSKSQSRPPDDTLSEPMDEEILVEDREGVISSTIQIKVEGNQPASEDIEGLDISTTTETCEGQSRLATLLLSAEGSTPRPCPQSAGSNTKKNKNKKKGSNGKSNPFKGH